MKKRGLAGLLALALILALAACGGTEAQEDAAQDQKMEEAAPPQEEETSETDGEDGVPVTIEGPETADDSQQLQEDEPDLGSRPADPAKEPETGSRPADPAEKPIYQPVEDTKPQQPDKEPETPAPAPPAESASGVDLADFCASVTGDQETWPALMAVEGETLDTFYAGLSAIATQQCLVQMAMISASGDEIALVEVENSGDVQAVKDIFQARIDYQVGDGTSPGGAWYPAPTEMWRNESRIVSNGNFVMLVAHTGADAVVEQFNALFDCVGPAMRKTKQDFLSPASFRSDQILMSSYARVPMPIFSACSRQTAQSVSGWAAWK